jgi:NADPH-dependent glutamate synthase beta subunit-like oxidoreductase
LIYRRGEKEMPAFRYEYDLAKLDGVRFHWFTQPIRIVGEEGRVIAIECLRTRLEQGNGRERGKVVPIPGSEFTIEVDMVVRAIGQKPVTDLFRTIPGIEIRDNGTVVVNEKYHTGASKYFAAGDCTNGGKEVVDAVAEGKVAAKSIDTWLGAPRTRN